MGALERGWKRKKNNFPCQATGSGLNSLKLCRPRFKVHFSQEKNEISKWIKLVNDKNKLPLGPKT